MTPLQSATLQAVKEMTRDSVPPSFEELRVRLNLASKSQVHRLVNALKERGYIDRRSNQPRSIRILQQVDDDFSHLSLAGLRGLIANAQAELDARTNGRRR